MIQKLKDQPIKVLMIVCGTVLAAVSMVTGATLPDWVYKLIALVGM